MLRNSCGSFTSFIACCLSHSIPQGQGEASSGPVHSLLLDQLSVGVHTELQEILVRFHSRRHCKLGESVERRGEAVMLWIWFILMECQPSHLGIGDVDLILITYIKVSMWKGMAFNGCAHIRTYGTRHKLHTQIRGIPLRIPVNGCALSTECLCSVCITLVYYAAYLGSNLWGLQILRYIRMYSHT